MVGVVGVLLSVLELSQVDKITAHVHVFSPYGNVMFAVSSVVHSTHIAVLPKHTPTHQLWKWKASLAQSGGRKAFIRGDGTRSLLLFVQCRDCVRRLLHCERLRNS